MPRLIRARMSVAKISAVLAMMVASCAGPQGPDVTRGAEARDVAGSACAISPTQYRADGRPVLVVACRFFDLTPAGYTARETHLRDLVASGDERRATERAIRQTVEFRSFMDPRNVWQWRDRVTEDEALAACRLILADLAAGVRVRWDPDARGYLSLVRSARMPPVSPETAAQASRPDAPARFPVPRQTMPEAPRPRADVRDVLDDVEHVLRRLRRSQRDPDLADLLGSLLQDAEDQLGAVTVILSGTTIVLGGILVGGVVTTVVIEADGTMLAEPLGRKLSQPLLSEFSHTLRDLDRASERARSVVGDAPDVSRLTRDQRIRHGELARKPSAAMTQRELEQLHDLRRQAKLADVPHPLTPAHKAERWAHYKATHDNPWPYERWSKAYEQNMNRARHANALADRVHAHVGWGKREVRAKRIDKLRVFDIADSDAQRAIEVKSGYVRSRPRIAYQLKMDAEFVEQGWDITWYVDGRIADPIRKALRAGGIRFFETRPNTLIKDLYQ